MNEFQKLIAEDKIGLCVEITAVRIAELIAKHLEKVGITRAEFARRMDVTPGRVTQILDADSNLQLRTIAKAMATLGFVMDVSASTLESLACPRKWEDASPDQTSASTGPLRVDGAPPANGQIPITNGRPYALAA